MLNPYLEKTLFSQSVQPILIEIDINKVSETLGKIMGFKLPILEPNTTFGLAGIAPVTPETIKLINSLPGVRMVHANLMARALQQPVSPLDWWPTSESRQLLEAEKAFIEGYTGEAVRVGVTDTGVDGAHEQLMGTEFYSTISWPAREILDENGHGSHVTSTIGGKLYRTPADITVEGVSRAQLISVKCLGRGVGTGFNSEIVNAMAVCWERGCQVISMSLGSDAPQGGVENDPICRMVSTLTQRGVIVVVAAGNSGPDPDTVGSPGISPDALTVAAIDKSGKVASFSSRGGPRSLNKPDVAAPGVKIYSGTSRWSPMSFEQPQASFGYVAISGTSMATPHVSGLVALLKHKFPNLTTARIKDVMGRKGNAWNSATGFGVPKWSMFQA